MELGKDRCRQIAGCVKGRAWHVEEEKIDGGPWTATVEGGLLFALPSAGETGWMRRWGDGVGGKNGGRRNEVQ